MFTMKINTSHQKFEMNWLHYMQTVHTVQFMTHTKQTPIHTQPHSIQLVSHVFELGEN